MADLIASAAASAMKRGSHGYDSYGYGNYWAPEDMKGSSQGKAAGLPQAMGQALPQLHVRPAGIGAEIRWEDFNYPPVLRLIHFDITELQGRIRSTVRLLNLAFLLTSLSCALNLADSVALWMLAGVPTRWVVQSFLHMFVLPPAALGTFYLGYRGLAAPEALLVHRFQLAQLALALVAALFALVPYHSVRGLLTLATSAPYGSEGIETLWLVAILAESSLWMSVACLAVLNVARARRVNVMPSNACAAPPVKMQS